VVLVGWLSLSSCFETFGWKACLFLPRTAAMLSSAYLAYDSRKRWMSYIHRALQRHNTPYAYNTHAEVKSIEALARSLTPNLEHIPIYTSRVPERWGGGGKGDHRRARILRLIAITQVLLYPPSPYILVCSGTNRSSRAFCLSSLPCQSLFTPFAGYLGCAIRNADMQCGLAFR
jgi:hypothetical protein